MFVAFVGILLAISASAHGYAGYYYNNTNCAGIPAESGIFDNNECTTFLSNTAVSMNATCNGDNLVVTQHSADTGCGGGASTTFTVASGTCRDMTSVWGGGSIKGVCSGYKTLYATNFQSFTSCSGIDTHNWQPEVKIPEGGCYNNETGNFSVYGECGGLGVENFQYFTRLHCTGSPVTLPQSVSNDGCLDLTPYLGNAVRLRCGACGMAVSFVALAVAAVVAAKNTFFTDE